MFLFQCACGICAHMPYIIFFHDICKNKTSSNIFPMSIEIPLSWDTKYITRPYDIFLTSQERLEHIDTQYVTINKMAYSTYYIYNRMKDYIFRHTLAHIDFYHIHYATH